MTLHAQQHEPLVMSISHHQNDTSNTCGQFLPETYTGYTFKNTTESNCPASADFCTARSNDYRKGDCYNRYCLSFKHALYSRAALTRLQGELCSFSWSCTGSVRQVPSSSSRRTSGNDCGATVPSWTTLREGSSLSEDISRALTPPWGTTRNAKRGTMPTCVGSGRRDSSPTSSLFP